MPSRDENDQLYLTAGTLTGTTLVNTSTYTILDTDIYLRVAYTVTGSQTSTLPLITSNNDGKEYRIKDTGYNASANNITIDTTGADTIENDTDLVLNGSGDAASLKANNTTKNWELF